MAFAPHDGALFRRLGREAEIATLLDRILDEQVGLLVVMGESCLGKTSLLRAGLPSALERQPPIEYDYWEAVADRAATEPLTAIPLKELKSLTSLTVTTDLSDLSVI
jgi:hypothetical protein